MNYEMLLLESSSSGLTVKEKPLKYNDGRINGKRIAIRRDILTSAEKACVLAEELGHYHTTVGNILDQSSVGNRKQELRARAWAYDKMIGLNGIVRCYKSCCRNRYEMAELLDVTEDFLQDALDYYSGKYGDHVSIDNYVIFFQPSLAVLELI